MMDVKRMDIYVVQKLQEALARCRDAIQEVASESNDLSLVIGQELGVAMAIEEIETSSIHIRNNMDLFFKK